MKLIDILVQELPKRDWLPISTLAITQDEDGSVCLWEKEGAFSVDGSWKHPSGTGLLRYLCNENAMEPAEDRANAIITREQYEAALAASKAEWNGEGLPPVGSRVEVRAEDFEGGWVAIDVVYVHNGEVVGIVQSENEYLNDRLEKFSAGYNRAEFRPIRSEADKKRDEAIESITSLIEYRNGCHAKALAKWLFEEIAAGKIPGIRID